MAAVSSVTNALNIQESDFGNFAVMDLGLGGISVAGEGWLFINESLILK